MAKLECHWTEGRTMKLHDDYSPPRTEGHKNDTGKDPWHLLPWDAVRAIVKVLAFGASKYSARNWEKGMAWSRPYAGLMRHMTAWWEGEPADPETGYSHLWHAGCCILFLIAYELRGRGHDDRPIKVEHGPAKIDQTSPTRS
jgi:Domain of unknown function (DUF5664)